MSEMIERTPWFKANKFSPPRDGWYEVKCEEGRLMVACIGTGWNGDDKEFTVSDSDAIVGAALLRKLWNDL